MLALADRTKPPITYRRYPENLSTSPRRPLSPRHRQVASRGSKARSDESVKGSSLFIIFRLVDLASRHPSVSTGWKNGPRVARGFSSGVRSRSSRSVARRPDEETNVRAKEKRRAREVDKKKITQMQTEKKKERKEEKKKWKTDPVRPRNWKRRREMPVSIIPETMTDRHRYSAENARTRGDNDDDDGEDTLTPGINLSKNERRTWWASSTQNSKFFRVRIVAVR